MEVNPPRRVQTGRRVPSPKWLREKPGLCRAPPRRLRGGAARPLKAGKRVVGSGTEAPAGLAGTWNTFTPTEAKTHLAIGGGSGAHALPAPAGSCSRCPAGSSGLSESAR